MTTERSPKRYKFRIGVCSLKYYEVSVNMSSRFIANDVLSGSNFIWIKKGGVITSYGSCKVLDLVLIFS